MTMDLERKYPDYISKEFFEKALKSGFNSNSIVITDLKLSMGSSAGDNYCSDIYRAAIEYTNAGQSKKISLIIKAMPFSEARGPLLEDLEVFEKEVKMYMETLPAMSKLLNDEFFNAK